VGGKLRNLLKQRAKHTQARLSKSLRDL
ncbi:hypothetical protein CCACVL1_04191, partial [Corchorus capsularis]